jgi:prolipoprotein diacylglyceryltransferase
VGRLGNWFNQELFGRPTTLPWGLEIDPDNPDALPDAQAYHPTFLYELLWNLGVAAVVVWADRRFRLGGGRAFALYLALYAAGRLWIEGLRIDDASVLLGLRLNQWVMGVVLVGAVAFLVARRGSGREDRVEPESETAPADGSSLSGTPAPPAGQGERGTA